MKRRRRSGFRPKWDPGMRRIGADDPSLREPKIRLEEDGKMLVMFGSSGSLFNMIDPNRRGRRIASDGEESRLDLSDAKWSLSSSGKFSFYSGKPVVEQRRQWDREFGRYIYLDEVVASGHTHIDGEHRSMFTFLKIDL